MDGRGPLARGPAGGELVVVVTGATGNLGTALVRRLLEEPGVGEIRAVARRPAAPAGAHVRVLTADVAADDLEPVLRGADVVVHLAWQLQPMRRPEVTWAANVGGTKRVVQAAVANGVRALVYASSVGAYAPAPGALVDEGWPTDSLATSAYGREKAYLERVLDAVEVRHPGLRVVRLRPALLLQRTAATEQRRAVGGPLVPTALLRAGRLPLLPYPRGLRFQVLHAEDAAEAACRAVVTEARGAFNLAASPVLDGDALAGLLGARLVVLPPAAVRAAMAAAFFAHVVPSAPALFDLARSLPLLRTDRATEELGWRPRHGALETLREAVEGMARGQGGVTAPLAGDSVASRLGDLRGSVGHRDGRATGAQPGVR